MKAPKQKLEKKVKLAELGAFVRKIADAIEGQVDGKHPELNGLFDNYRKVSIELKRKSQKATLKIKVEAEPETADTKDIALKKDHHKTVAPDLKGEQITPKAKKPKYKNLKKNMKKTFKAISENVSDSRLPEQPDLDQFITDSELMISYPGYGDEYYPQYQRACQALKDAADRLDFASFKHQFEEIKNLMRECHDRYK